VTTPADRPFVVVISGMPGSGKTTLGRDLSDALHLPLVSRDLIKTGMHVTVHSTDPRESKRFASAAFDVFFAAIDHLVASGVSTIVEAAFHRERSADSLARLHEQADVAHLATQIDPTVALRRYRERAERGERHPAHADLDNLETLAADTAKYRLDHPEPLLRVDTTDGLTPSLADIVAFITRCRGVTG
jgi:predicted kinase